MLEEHHQDSLHSAQLHYVAYHFNSVYIIHYLCGCGGDDDPGCAHLFFLFLYNHRQMIKLFYPNGKISSGRKKSRGSNSGDGGNTRDGGKTVGGAIGARGGEIGDSSLEALHACMTFIYGSSWKDEMASEAKRSLDKSFKGSEEVFSGKAENSPVKPGYSQEYS
ncbi:hypothetical protein Tco_0536329 [Tanacetum coccineum]